jgi:two-component system sensor histidine kinase MprB
VRPAPLRQVGHGISTVDRRWRSAPIRTRLTAAAAVASTLAIVAVIAVAYVAVRHELRGQVDAQLRQQVTDVHLELEPTPNGYLASLPPERGMVEGYIQAVDSHGHVDPPQGTSVRLPSGAHDRRIAAGGGSWIRDVDVNGLHLRVITTQAPSAPGVAVQVGLPLTAVDHQLHKLALAFLLLALAGLATVIGGTWFVVRRTMRPVATLTVAAEQIAVTRDLTTRITTYSSDELGRLASSFNTMLDALERSLGQQRQLILDASHELRTPLASLRTNVEVLHDVDRLSAEQRRDVLDGIVTQLDELTGLVADVVELARGDAPASAMEDVAFDDLVAHAVDRARRHWPAVVFMLHEVPVTVRGAPSRLDRAVANLLDNAGKFSPPGAVVDVTLTSAGELTVADRGPGVPEAALPHVFDRFYRADEARALPGSGLGLAIVKQVVDSLGGTVAMTNRPDGGALVALTLPPLDNEAAVPLVDITPEPAPAGR